MRGLIQMIDNLEKYKSETLIQSFNFKYTVQDFARLVLNEVLLRVSAKHFKD
jgi:hypothetical protein